MQESVMSETSPTRRDVLAATAAAGALLLNQQMPEAAEGTSAIRPFRVNVPEEKLVTHGWPGSVIEQLKIIDPLTNPTAHGASASDAFHLVIPSLPGYGFSGKPTAPGWTPVRIARAWATLMQRLGYTQYVAQGGDWGDAVSEQMALQQPPGLLGIHTNMAATVPADGSEARAAGG